MDCKYHSSDHHSGTDEGSTKRVKARIVDVAWKTLLDLGTSIKEMKCSGDERSIFKRKIYSLTEKIRCLEAKNDSLNVEVTNLKSCLIEAEDKSPGKKVKELSIDNERIDALVVDSAGKIIHTIEDLSSELVTVHKTINIFRHKNECLQMKTDKLRAMIRVSSGNSKDFRSRVDELNDLVFCIDKEIHLLKNSTESMDANGCLKMFAEKMMIVELLMKQLETKLKNDRRALFTGGSPYWSVYLKRIEKMEGSSEGLLLQLEITKAELRARSCGFEYSHAAEYQKGIEELQELVKRVAFDLKSLKTEPMMIGFKVGGESCIQYSKRIGRLEKLLATSKSIINKLIIETKEAAEEKRTVQYARVLSWSKSNIAGIAALVKKFKSAIKELENAVVSSDNTKLIQRTRHLENSVKRLKNEVAARNEENNSLGLELTGAKIAFAEKAEELEKLQIKYNKIVNKANNREYQIVNDDQQRMENLARELEQTKIEARDAKTMRDERNRLRLDVTNFVVERATLLEEVNKNRAIIKDRENEILNISKEKENIEQTLTKEKNETQNKLIIAVEEINCLKNELTSNSYQISANEATKVKLNRLEALLEDTRENQERTSNECRNLKNKCNEVISEKTKIELELSRMKIQNEALIDHLNSEKVTTAETLNDCHKLMADFRLQQNDLQSLKTEQAIMKKNLVESERQKDTLSAEIDELRQGNITLRDESLSLKSKVNQLTQELEQSNHQNTEINIQVKKVNEENRKQRIHLDSLIKENDKLNDELDKARSDKLNIAGTLNEWRLQCEEAKNLLDSKIEEVKNQEKRLKHVIQDNEGLKMREVTTKLEVTKWLEANIELRGTIDVLNSDKGRLEEQLKSLNSECQTLRSRRVILQSDNDALKDDSCTLKRLVDKLTEDVKVLSGEAKQRERERLRLDAEHQDTTERHQRKLDDFEIEHNTLKSELVRLRAENTSLKSESDRISEENEKVRRIGGNKCELSRLSMENEGLKFELVNLRNANSKVDREIELARIERETLCQELHVLHTEKCTLRMLLEKMKAAHEISFDDSRKVEEQLNKLKVENDELRKYLDEAKSDITSRDDRTNELEVDRNVLKNFVDELKEEHRAARIGIEEMTSRNENLTKEISNVNKENFALRSEVNTLRSVIKKINDDNSNMRTEFAHIEEELEALKAELARVRAENSLLRTQFDAKRIESCKLETENTALKEKLEELRHRRILDTEEVNQLRSEYEKLKLHKVAVESKLMDAQKKIGKYTIASSKLNGLEDKLKGVLKSYVATKKLLHSANEEVNHLRRITDPYIRNVKYTDNIETI